VNFVVDFGGYAAKINNKNYLSRTPVNIFTTLRMMEGRKDMNSMDKIDAYLEAHLDESVAELARLAAQPSVAAQNWGLKECANLVGEMLKARGFSVETIATGGAPVVYGERAGLSPKTLLFYNHYDVQPPEPLELWDSPPFEPTLRDGKLYARGVSDDKAHITSRLFAIDALLSETGDLPCNVKFVIEGEEETSSLHLNEFVKNNREKLSADGCVWEFGRVDHRDVPIQDLGLRGICYVELSVETAKIDVHSGLAGSIFPNAAWRLVWALNSIKGPDGKVRIPGFYDRVLPPSRRDIALMQALPDVVEEYTSRYGVKEFLNGLTGGVELRIAEVFEPTCTICGLTSGYQGPGSKTVLPARASAKVDFRLVPDQTPQEVLAGLRTHLDTEGFSDVEITFLGGESPARTDPDDPFVSLVVLAAEPVYGVPMQIVPMLGGSGPNHAFIEHLKLPVVTAGVGYPGTQAHAPNENVRLDLYLKGARHIARIISAFAVK
jgi:acetylornithine deacetylase/succinyl-diaminopimelate desuccinylase-like protein